MSNKTQHLLINTKLQNIKIIVDLPEVLLVYFTSVPQIWSVSEWQGQKAFLNRPSCSRSCQSISGLCPEDKRQARGTWNQPRFLLLLLTPPPLLALQCRVAGGAPMAASSARPTLPNVQCHFLSARLSADFPGRTPLGEFFCHFLRKGLLGRFFKSSQRAVFKLSSISY